jgi:bacterial/archaeal transporter family-2 protein
VSASFAIALAGLIAAGAVLAMQAPINGALARAAGDATFAACINFLVGFLVMGCVVVLRGAWPATGFIANAPSWAWIGGALGGFYITMMVMMIPITGAQTAAMAGILGQLVMAMLLDHFGAFGLPVQPITWQRIAGLAMVAGGVLLSRA